MQMIPLWTFLAVTAVLAGAFALRPAQAGESGGPVVLELFTSQSCSSCPPADALLAELAAEEGVIALGCHVTYWDHLSWKDTLSREACTGRQRDYAVRSGTGRVFTPELRIDGRESLVGSRRGDIKRAVARARGRVRPLAVEAGRDGSFQIALPDIPEGGAGLSVTLLPYAALHRESIGQGENRGRTVTYMNPVSAVQVLERAWKGMSRTLVLGPDLLPAGTAGFAVLVQAGAGGPVLAAGEGRLQ